MKEVEARLILTQELSRYRERRYEELFRLIDHGESFERTAPSGNAYQLEMQVFLDDAAAQTIRVSEAVDDQGWRALSPLCDDFILRPDGTFAGE